MHPKCTLNALLIHPKCTLKNSENEPIFLDDDVLKVNDVIDDDEADSDNEDYMVAPTATVTAKRDFLRDQLLRKRNA